MLAEGEDCDMVPLRLETGAEFVPERPLSDEAFAYLNHLRFISMGCRAKRRTDLFEACALLHADRMASREAHAEALMRCLNEALNKQALLHAPGTVETSFDERWLVELGRSIGREDEPSIQFLLHSRVPQEHRRLVRFLIGQISECFSLS